MPEPADSSPRFVVTAPRAEKGAKDEVLIEIVRIPGAAVPVAGFGPLPKIVDTFDELCGRAYQKASQVGAAFGRLLDDKGIEAAEVKLGVKFTLEGKIVIASAAAEGSIEVTIKFARPKE